MQVLVVNAGSSSLKLRLLDARDRTSMRADLPAGWTDSAVADAIRGWPVPDVVGHRIVHGGARFTAARTLDDDTVAALRALTDLAPLHQPTSLAAYDAVRALLPDVPAVASFDTAFHAGLPAAAATYAIPREWRERHGVRRYGFHGLSHAYCAQRTAELLARDPAGLRLVTCHLGAGASLAAVVAGRSVDTTMGFTPLEGLVMATRSGTVDPGLVLWLQEHEDLSPAAVAYALEHRSGLLALTGTADMAQVQQRAQAGDPHAILAFDVFVHRLVTGIGAMAAAAGGLDALVFTGGVGERSPGVRAAAAARLSYLGVAVDARRNEDADGDADVSAPGARARTLVVESREDLQIAREARTVMTRAGAG